MRYIILRYEIKKASLVQVFPRADFFSDMTSSALHGNKNLRGRKSALGISSVTRECRRGPSVPGLFKGRIFRIISRKKQTFPQKDIQKSLTGDAFRPISLGCPGRGPP